MFGRFVWRYLKVGRYESRDKILIVHKGLFSREVIPSDQILSWKVHPEMGMDAVELQLCDGEVRVLIDTYGDLLKSLEVLGVEKTEEPRRET